MSKLLVIVILGLARDLTAEDFDGRWAGTATQFGREMTPIHLTLSQSDEVISGNVIIGDTAAVPIASAVARGNELRFTITSNSGPATDFTLKFVVTGHPLDEKRIELRGDAMAAGRESKLLLYPVSDFPTYRTLFASGPVPVHKVEALYTPEARQAKVEGTVLLQVEIEETGMISKERIQVLRALGHGLDEAAIQCVRRWRFKPAHKNGYAVKSTARIEVSFRDL